MTEAIAAYRNGNYDVTILEDGTKIRDYDESPFPVFPESIDLKITDYCDAGCEWCHEQSTKAGKHAFQEVIFDLVMGLPPGVEIAIGGGNPLAHPDLVKILDVIKGLGLIANLTVNAVHISRYKHLINMLREHKLIRGLGISYHPNFAWKIENIMDENSVIHYIAGVHDIHDAIRLKKKVLVLGYKQFGFGKGFYSPEVEQSLQKWKFWIQTLMMNNHVSFDNLALEQLGVQNFITEEAWERNFMGDDGQFTMYIDAVKQEFAISSTSDRIKLNNSSAKEAFNKLQLILQWQK